MLIITREVLLSEARISPGREVRRSHAVIKAAHKAKAKDGLPDERAIKAAELNLKLMDAFPKPTLQPVDPSRPINVAIVLTHGESRPRAELSSHGVALHLSDGGGDGA